MQRVLVSAYGCEPRKGSEQGVGWHWMLELAKTRELWLITRANNRRGIEQALPPSLSGRVHPVYYDLPDAVKRFKRKERGLYPYYALWQAGVYRKARTLARKIRFDFCIHLTFGSMWMPTLLHLLPVPFVWGPVGGGESVPPGFFPTLPWNVRIPQYLRRLLIRSAPINPLITGPAKKARAIIARTRESRAVIPAKYRDKVRIMLETGISTVAFERIAPRAFAPSPRLEILYTGRLTAVKNVEAAVHALSLLSGRCGPVRLTLLGDGPRRGALQRLCEKLGVSPMVRFPGTVPRGEVVRRLQRSDIFLFPSLKEGGSWSLMEAMAAGLPVICLDTAGMHVITDDTCAVRIRPTNFRESTEKMAEALVLLAGAPELRKKMGAAGRRRIAERFSWAGKGAFLQELLDGPAPSSQNRRCG